MIGYTEMLIFSNSARATASQARSPDKLPEPLIQILKFQKVVFHMSEMKKKHQKKIKVEARILLRGTVLRNPIKFLNDKTKEKRYFEGVIASVMYFERFGIERLKEYFKSKDVPLEPIKIENLRISTIMRMLEGFGIISHRIHCLMGEVNKERNDIVHKLRHPDALDEEKARKAIKKAIECLQALGVT